MGERNLTFLCIWLQLSIWQRINVVFGSKQNNGREKKLTFSNLQFLTNKLQTDAFLKTSAKEFKCDREKTYLSVCLSYHHFSEYANTVISL